MPLPVISSQPGLKGAYGGGFSSAFDDFNDDHTLKAARSLDIAQKEGGCTGRTTLTVGFDDAQGRQRHWDGVFDIDGCAQTVRKLELADAGSGKAQLCVQHEKRDQGNFQMSVDINVKVTDGHGAHIGWIRKVSAANGCVSCDASAEFLSLRDPSERELFQLRLVPQGTWSCHPYAEYRLVRPNEEQAVDSDCRAGQVNSVPVCLLGPENNLIQTLCVVERKPTSCGDVSRVSVAFGEEGKGLSGREKSLALAAALAVHHSAQVSEQSV